MSQSALAYIFGAVSNAAVGFVFLYKWWIEERQRYDLDWAIAHLAFAAAVAIGSFQESTGSAAANLIAPLFFWLFAAYLASANLSFVGRTVPLWAAPAAAITLDLITIIVGLSDVRAGLALFSGTAAVLSVWTGLILLRMPHVGKFLCALFIFRAAFLPLRPLLLESPYLLQYSILSFATSFLAAMALLLASLMRSRDSLLKTSTGLHAANRELETAKAEMMERNDVLDRQSRKLERLSSDYATALERAEIANRAKDGFIANINHELRTPLNAVIGFAELAQLEARRTEQEKLGEYVGYIDQAGKNLLRLIERILDYIAVDVGDRRIEHNLFDPLATIRDEVAAFQELLDARRLAIDIDADLAPAEWQGDLKAFKSATLELFSNAVKFAPDGSRIKVSVGAQAETLAVSFADQGPGMSEEFMERAGERFNIGEPVLNRGGTIQGVGLGLSLVTRIAELLGGKLKLAANRPAGTIATITFLRVSPVKQATARGADQLRSG
jgi:signal transduction histidine kinase